MKQKLCKGCMETKPLSEFHKLKAKKDGLDYYCKECRHIAFLKSSQQRTRVCSEKQCDKTHYAKGYCRVHYSRVQRNGSPESKYRDYYSPDITYANGTNADKALKYRLKFNYGMTIEEFRKRTENGCELCGHKTDRNLHVDHDHSCCDSVKTCGVCVRGILCPSCNTAVQKYEDGKLFKHYPKYNMIEQYVKQYDKLEAS